MPNNAQALEVLRSRLAALRLEVAALERLVEGMTGKREAQASADRLNLHIEMATAPSRYRRRSLDSNFQ